MALSPAPACSLALVALFAAPPWALAQGDEFLPGTGSVFGLTARGDVLLTFDAGTPGRIRSAMPVSGLSPQEFLHGIEFRPATGELVALSSSSRLYRLDPLSAAATPLGAGPFAPALVGQDFGFDFNPVPDRLRVVSDAEQNLRLNPDTGQLAAVDGPLAYAPGDANAGADPNLVGSAYTNSFAGTTSTTLYGIDSQLDVLVTQGSLGSAPVSPNSGQLFTVGALGIDASGLLGFDISPFGGALLTRVVPGGSSTELYSVNLASGAATLLGTIGGGLPLRDIAIKPPAAPRIFAVTTGERLLSFRPGTPDLLLSDLPLSGLAMGESVLGIDFRPATGELFALGSSSRLYRVDLGTAVATPLGAAPFSPPLAGQSFGVDFNPVPDRLRVVSDAEQNLRLNPNTGAVAAVDGPLAFAAGDANFGADPQVVGSAYDQNYAGGSTTTLYGIDAGLDVLVTQGSVGSAPVSPNSGQLFTVGALGVDAGELTGFDVSTLGGSFAAIGAVGAPSRLYAINRTTGAAALLGTIGGGQPVRDLAVEPPGQPTIYALTADQELISFLPGASTELLAVLPVGGLSAGEALVGIDFRPATGDLYALSDLSRLYTLDRATGVAAAVGRGPFTPGLVGQGFGFDFNPVPDRVRVVSDADQNLRLNPNTGAVAAVDGTLAFAAGDPNAGADPNVVAAGYTGNFAGSTLTTLYAIDSNLDLLVTQGSVGSSPQSPNGGQLFTVGALGLDTTAAVGLDVSIHGGIFASLTAPGASSSRLYALNPATGAATLLGEIGGGKVILDMSVLPAGL